MRKNNESLSYQREKNKNQSDKSLKLVKSLEHLFYNKIKNKSNAFSALDKLKYERYVSLFFDSMEQYFTYKDIKYFLKNKFNLIVPSIQKTIDFYNGADLDNINIKNNMISCLPYFLMDDDILKNSNWNFKNKSIICEESNCWWGKCYHLYRFSAIIKNIEEYSTIKQIEFILEFCRLFNRKIEKKSIKKYLLKK